MLAKKWRKLSLNKDKNNSLKEENNDEEVENKEIIIVDIDNDKSQLEKEEENNNESKEEKQLKSIYLQKRPQPIIRVDPNSIQITNYKVETSIEPNSSYNDYNIEEIKKRYIPRISYDYNFNNKYEENKTCRINNTPSLDEIKNKYEIKNLKDNIISKDSKYKKYIPGTYRNSSNYNLNNTFSTFENNIKKQNIYYNYGPIYNYERTKELKNQTINGKDNESIEYKISNPYNEQKTYYRSPKNTDTVPNKIITNKIKNDSFIINKYNLRKDYPNLYYLNNNNNINNEDNDTSINNPKNIRKFYSVERPNRLRNDERNKRIFYPGKDNFNSSFNNLNNNKNNKSFINERNNSMIDMKTYKNGGNYNYSNSYSNSFLLNNYKNNQKLSYVINDTDNLYQYYPSFNKLNNFSGKSFFTKLNYVYN